MGRYFDSDLVTVDIGPSETLACCSSAAAVNVSHALIGVVVEVIFMGQHTTWAWFRNYIS